MKFLEIVNIPSDPRDLTEPHSNKIAHKRAFYDKYGEEKLKDGFLIDGSKPMKPCRIVYK